MKIRFQGGTLRLRLRRSDVERLATTGRVQDVVPFPKGELVYSLVLDEAVGAPEAEFLGQEVCVRLPREQGLLWCLGTDVAISNAAATPTVLVERDFVRTAVEESDDFDRFMNPRSGRKPPLIRPA